MKLAAFAVSCVICCLTAGCLGTSSTETNETEAPTTSDSAAVEANSPAAESTNDGIPIEVDSVSKSVSVEVRSWPEFQEWVAKQKGRVVVVDVWSTSCAECVEEFPHFVDLHDRLGENIVCASLSIDFYGVGSPEDLKPRVLEFLTEKNATNSNFLSSTVDEEVMDALDVASIPATLVYDQLGALKKTFRNDNEAYGSGGFSYEKHINPFVEELLKPAG